MIDCSYQATQWHCLLQHRHPPALKHFRTGMQFLKNVHHQTCLFGAPIHKAEKFSGSKQKSILKIHSAMGKKYGERMGGGEERLGQYGDVNEVV